MMPTAHGQRLTDLLPHANLVEVPDSLTLIPLDQPENLADHLSRFVNTPTGDDSGQGARPEKRDRTRTVIERRSQSSGGESDQTTGRIL